MSVTFGKVSVGGRRGGATVPIDFTDEEGKTRRRKMVTHYGKLALIQMPLALLAVLSGATSIGLAIPNPNFPYLLCFPLINGLLVLVASYCARRIGGANMDNEIPRYVKICFIVSYVLCLVSVTFSALAAVFSGVGISYCFQDDPKFREKCLPVREAKIAFAAVDIVLAVLILPASIVCLVFFCLHARSLGFVNRRQRQQQLESQVAVLQAQVAALSQGQGQPLPGGQGQPTPGGMADYSVSPPPPYSQTAGYGFSAGPGASTSSGEGAGYGVSPSGFTYNAPNKY